MLDNGQPHLRNSNARAKRKSLTCVCCECTCAHWAAVVFIATFVDLSDSLTLDHSPFGSFDILSTRVDRVDNSPTILFVSAIENGLN